MNREVAEIVLRKCEETSVKKYDMLTGSDINDIIEECRRKNIEVSRRELEHELEGMSRD